MAAPELSRGTASMQPSVMGASASSSVRAIVDIAENYSFSPLAGRGKALRQRRFRYRISFMCAQTRIEME
jgi:hypothetical protein